MEQHICENAQNTFLFIFSIFFFFFLSVYGLLVDPANRQLYCANRENSPARKHCILCSAISGIETTAKYLAFSLFCLILLLFPAARSSKSETRRHYRVVGRTQSGLTKVCRNQRFYCFKLALQLHLQFNLSPGQQKRCRDKRKVKQLSGSQARLHLKSAADTATTIFAPTATISVCVCRAHKGYLLLISHLLEILLQFCT